MVGCIDESHVAHGNPTTHYLAAGLKRRVRLL